jgi:predicted ATPase
MRRFVLTGASGAGKTAIIRALETAGRDVVEEAATDLIALEQARGQPEPWSRPGFIEAITRLQRQRRLAAAGHGAEVQFHDRSPVCTLALARFLEVPVPALLEAELEEISADRLFERKVFLVRPLGFIEPTAARRISYEETLRFETVHEQTYRELGYVLLPIEPGPIEQRLAAVLRAAG